MKKTNKEILKKLLKIKYTKEDNNYIDKLADGCVKSLNRNM